MGGRRPGVCVLILMTVGEVSIQSSLPGQKKEAGRGVWLAPRVFVVIYNVLQKVLHFFEWGGCLTRCSLLAEVITASDRRCMLTGCSGIILTRASWRWFNEHLLLVVLSSDVLSLCFGRSQRDVVSAMWIKSGASTFIISDELTDGRTHRENKYETFKLKKEWNDFLLFRQKTRITFHWFCTTSWRRPW